MVGGFVATLVLVGPDAWAVVRRRLAPSAPPGPAIALDHIALPAAPGWLRGSLLRALLCDLEPRLGGAPRLMDDAALAAVRDALAASPWLDDVEIERRFPDRLAVRCRIRRPECQVVVDGTAVALADADGVLLPPGDGGHRLPVVDLSRAVPAATGVPRSRDPRIRAAAQVAAEWRTELAPQLAAPPRLIAIDADNLGWQHVADARYSEILVGLERAGDGGVCWFQHGRASRDGGPTEVGVRAAILRDVLALAPGLRGLAGGDLRLRNRWRDALRPSAEPATVADVGPR